MPATNVPHYRRAFDGLVRRLRLHSPLSDEDAEAILDLPCTLIERSQNSHLVREGDDTRKCSVLVSGFAHRYRATSEGERQILALYVPGDPIDFDHLYLPVADDSVQAIRDCLIACVAHDSIRHLMTTRPAIHEAITRTLLVDASICREWVLNVGRREARRRIAHFLCEISVRLGAQGISVRDYPLPLTQQHIADATGLTPVHVNRTLKGLHAEGLIERRRGLVLLPNPRLLREVADFDARYLHLNSEPWAEPSPSSQP